MRAGRAGHRSRARRRGSALTEFALCMPFLLLVLSATIEYGFMISASLEIEDAARDGSRLASQGNNDAFVQSQIGTYVPRLNLKSIDIVNPATLAITNAVYMTDTNGTKLADGSRLPGSRATVCLHAKVQWMTPIQVLFGGTPYDLYASSTYVVNF